MSNILKARDDPPLGWYPSWIHLNEDGVPKDITEDGVRQPDTIRIKFDVPEAGSTRGRVREVSADIVPDQALLGFEFALNFTIPQFNEKIKPRLDENEPDYATKLHSLFGQCLQGKAATMWAKVLEKYDRDLPRTAETFMDALRDYLEEVAGVKFLGDFLLALLEHAKKPAAVPIGGFIDRRDEYLRYYDGGYLRSESARPTAKQLAIQVFKHQPRHHQQKYAHVPHLEVEEDQKALRIFFEGCHDEDVITVPNRLKVVFVISNT